MLYLVLPHIRHVYVAIASFKASCKACMCMLLPLIRPHVRHARLGLHIAVSLKGRTASIWSFGYGFACATAMRYAGFRLLFGTIIDIYLLTIIK